MANKDEFRRYSSRYKAEKIKSRNLSEKKRRDQFNMLINELCSMVTSSNRKMDKSSVLRSTISFLKNHSELSVQSQSVKVPENWKPSFLSNEEFTHLMLEALDGFIIVFSCNGQILYTSESAASLLGYLPSRIYSSVFDIVHEMDKSSLYKLISNPPSSSNNSISNDSFLSISLHMKRGPIHPQGSSTYELVQLLGSFYHWPSCEATNQASFDCDSNSCSSICSLPPAAVELRSCFVAVGRLQTPHLLRVVNLPDDVKNEFTSRHSLEWKFLFLDHRAPPIIGYLPFEVLGTSGYDYYHVDDLDNIASSHELLMNTGEGTSCFYRFLTKGQQWIWLQTRYYISYHQWSSKPEFIVCTHTVVSTEKVLKSLQDMPKASLRKSSKGTHCASSSPTQSSCLSPSPSVSSLGSLSSEPSEQCTPKASSNPRASSVLFTSPGSRERTSSFSRSQYHETLPGLADNFTEPHHHLLQQKPNPLPSKQSSSKTAIHSPPKQDLQVHVSPTHAPPVLSPLMISPDLPMQQFQTEQRSPTSLNPVHINPDYLRHRHRLLQQQILAQQEELRRVSEQLMMVEFANPNAVSQNMSENPYQDMSAAGSYMDSQYQSARQPLQVASSSEGVMMSEDGFTGTTAAMALGEAPRTYMNLEANMCGIAPDPMTQLSQQSEVIAQGYSMNRQMQPPNS